MPHAFCVTIINSLAPRKYELNFRYVIFKRISVTDGWGIFCEIALIWMSLDFTDDQSTLVQVMAWCRQATIHYLSQWQCSMVSHRAYPIDEYPARSRHAAVIMHMVMNNLDPRVAQFPHELVTYGGNGQVLSNWAQVGYKWRQDTVQCRYNEVNFLKKILAKGTP